MAAGESLHSKSLVKSACGISLSFAARYNLRVLHSQETGKPHSRHVYNNVRVRTRARPVFLCFCLHLFTFWV